MKKGFLLLIFLITFLICIISLRHPVSRFIIKVKNKVQSFFYTKEVSIHYWKDDDPEIYNTKIPIPFSSDFIIAVYKKDHILQLVKEKKIIKEYKTNIRDELPDRLMENDGQTPEGIFKIWQMAVVTDPAWTRWLAFDTTEKAKKIFVQEYRNGSKILNEYEKRFGTITRDADIRVFNSRNPATPMLRGFGIHGGGYRQGNDWTLGCPALDDKDVIELYDYIKQNPDNGIGTLVIIQD